MSCVRRIKAGLVIISIGDKFPAWAAGWGGPLSVTPAVIELLSEHAAELDPDDRLLTTMPRFFQQIITILRLQPQLGKGTGNEAELVGIELSAAGEREDVFIAVRIEAGALFLYSPSDLEDTA